MVKVIGVRFRTAGKIYFFDPLQFEIKRDDHVIVETARGIEFGTVVTGVTEVRNRRQPTGRKRRKPTGSAWKRSAAMGWR